MALDLTPDQKEIGKANFQRVVGQFQDPKSGVTRRDFMKGAAAAAAVLPVSAAAYYGYQTGEKFERPVKAALIGSGDEGGVLVGEHNPAYLEFVAVCDLRPSNQARIFEDEKLKSPSSPRRGFKHHYGKDAKNSIKVYSDYKQMLEERKDIEAVVIALPLHLHAPVAIDCMRAGRHVLCEKLMAWNIKQCKEMIEVAKETDRVLSIGHQRHYSLLYAHAVEVLNSGVLGDVKHIRALWHRNNSWPRLDSAGNPLPADPKTGMVPLHDSWRPEVAAEDRKALEARIKELGYKNMEELARWRLYNRTGGGLMAELGSHQLDACSIFLGKVHPLAVSGYGGKIFYKDDREVEDHVFVTFEFPGKNYYADPQRKAIKDKNDIVVVNYSSINTNGFEPYGECVMGTRGTLVVSEERDVMLYPERGGASRATAVTVTASSSGPVLDASSSTGGPAAPGAASSGAAGPAGGTPSRGYREEMEHFAYCIRMWDQGMSKEDRPLPRCHGRVAMADAIIALTSNLAMRHQKRIEFKPEWFDADSKEVPDAEMVPENV